jgi:hypothetical protein
MAFVVMRSRQPAIIARLHEIHTIQDHPVQVQKFRRDQSVDDQVNLEVDNYAWLDEVSTVADRTPPTMADRERYSTYAAVEIN